LASVIPLGKYLHDPFKYDFRNLRNRRSLESGAAALAPRVDKIFGRTLTPAVVIADKRSHTGEIRTKINERAQVLPGGALIADITTLEDFLPGGLALQQKKLAVLDDLREVVDGKEMQLASE